MLVVEVKSSQVRSLVLIFFEVEVKFQFIYTEVYVHSIANSAPKENL